MLENSPDAIARFDRDLRHVYVNRPTAVNAVLGPVSLLGRTNRDVGAADYLLERWEAALNDVFATKTHAHLVMPALHDAPGTMVEFRLFPEFAEDGSVETVLAIARDITLQKQAEDALRESEARLSLKVENLPIGVVHVQGNALFMNRATELMLGYS